jgi:catechol 2,3-dioxygenase
MTSMPGLVLHHMGIWVTDFEMMVALYRRLFGFHVSDTGHYPNGSRVAFLTIDAASHHTFVIGEGRPEGSPSTINQISFRAEGLAAVRAYWNLVDAEELITRIQCRTHGNAWSVYFWDPEDNRGEIFADTPWHVAQPFHVTMDFAMTDDAIMAMTEALVKKDKSYRPIDDWRRDTAKALAPEE